MSGGNSRRLTERARAAERTQHAYNEPGGLQLTAPTELRTEQCTQQHEEIPFEALRNEIRANIASLNRHLVAIQNHSAIQDRQRSGTTASSSAAVAPTIATTSTTAIQSSRHAGSGLVAGPSSGPRSVYEEHRRLFGYRPSVAGARRTGFLANGPARRKSKVTPMQIWKKEVACLRFTDADRVPDTMEKMVMTRMGLGCRLMKFDLEGDGAYLHSELLAEFPELSNTGGYSLLRPNTNSHDLIEIEPPQGKVGGMTIRYLKDIVCSARLYIRPLQFNIIDKDEDEFEKDDQKGNSLIMEKCHKCKNSFALYHLSKHLLICNSTDTLQSGSADGVQENSKNDDVSPPHKVYRVDSSDDESVDEQLLDHAIQISRCSYNRSNNNGHSSAEDKRKIDLQTLVRQLKENLEDVDEFPMPIRRGHVLEDALRNMGRASFSPKLPLHVQFLGEEAEDGGGPKREFWALIAKDVSNTFDGPMDRKLPSHDVIGLQNMKYYKIGQLMAMSILQQGSGFPFIAPCVYQYISDVSLSSIDISIEDVLNVEVRSIIDKVQSSSSNAELQKICESHLDVIIDSGYTLPLQTIELDNKQRLIKALMLHATILRSKAVIDQLRNGLSCLGVLDAIVKYPHQFENYFVAGKTAPLTADMIIRMLRTIYSERGTSERVKEEATFMLFLDLLRDCEGNEDSELKLSEVFSFFTGSEYPPPLGYDSEPTIRFSNSQEFPTASTCVLQMILPTKYHDSPEDFHDKMLFAFKNHGGFGLW